jgi:amino-acid N-acetyltransferase
VIEAAQAQDLAAVLDLLRRSQLPIDDLERHLHTTLVARHDGRIVGSAALEVYGSGALLRSVAVDAARRGEGLGHRLTEAALALARHQSVRTVYLLTTTAGDFFPRFGFRRIERTAVDAAVQTSVEFTTACPSSALVLARDI